MARRKSGRRAAHKLVWTDRALLDLQQIDDYIAADDPVAAARWIAKLLAAAHRAARFPASGHIVREEGRDIRQVLVKTYWIVYRIRERQIDVLTVFEGRHCYRRARSETDGSKGLEGASRSHSKHGRLGASQHREVRSMLRARVVSAAVRGLTVGVYTLSAW